MGSLSTIDTLLTLVADHPARVLSHLNELATKSAETAQTLAQTADENGYTLLQAAVSYDHADLTRALVQLFNVNVNSQDDDGETALFVAESPEIAQLLVEDLGADMAIRNSDGFTAREKIEEEGDWPAVAGWLRERDGGEPSAMADPAIPANLKIRMSLQPEAEGAGDAVLRRNLDEIVSSGIIDTPEGVEAVTRAVFEAVERAAPDVMNDEDGQGASKRRA